MGGITSKLANKWPSWGIYKHAPPVFWRKRRVCSIEKKGGQIKRVSWRGELVLYRTTYVQQYIYKLASPRKAFYLATFFSLGPITNVFCAPKKGWGMLVYAPGWSLASQFWSHTPPPKKFVFPRPKSPLKTVFLINFSFENFGVFCLCGENFVTPFSTLAMIKGSLPTNSTTPDRLRSWAKTESEDFPSFGVRTLSIKKNQIKVQSLVVIYTPKDAHSLIFVTGGSVIACQMLANILFCSWRGELVVRSFKHMYYIRTVVKSTRTGVNRGTR